MVGDTVAMTEPRTAMYQGGFRAGGAVWTVAAVAHRLGIAPSTLRTWSHRYGIGPEGHHPGQRRRYTDDDVAELDTLRGLVGRGIILAAAADMAHEQRLTAHPVTATELGRAGDGAIPRRAVSHLVAAARRLDDTEAASIITDALTRHGVVITWDFLCRPALTDAALDAGLSATAESDPDGGRSVDAMLLLQWAVTTSLRRLSARPGPRTSTDVGPVLLACTRDEHHTLALEAMHAALVERRVEARMLGASIPRFALLAAVASLRPATVVVWAQTTATADPALLDTLATGGTTVVATGPGWDHATLAPPITRAGSLLDALASSGGRASPAGAAGVQELNH